METAELLVRTGRIPGVTPEEAVANIIYALGKGLLKTMSKMGISTVASYAGAQAFEAVGLSANLVNRYFTGVTSILGGVTMDVIAEETRRRHHLAYGNPSTFHEVLPVGGEYSWRREGPPHLFNPETVFKLQHATREKRYDIFRDYTKAVDEQAERLMTLRPGGAEERGVNRTFGVVSRLRQGFVGATVVQTKHANALEEPMFPRVRGVSAEEAVLDEGSHGRSVRQKRGQQGGVEAAGNEPMLVAPHGSMSTQASIFGLTRRVVSAAEYCSHDDIHVEASAMRGVLETSAGRGAARNLTTVRSIASATGSPAGACRLSVR
jgi:glutamate synthase domain-containing protein 2